MKLQEQCAAYAARAGRGVSSADAGALAQKDEEMQDLRRSTVFFFVLPSRAFIARKRHYQWTGSLHTVERKIPESRRSSRLLIAGDPDALFGELYISSGLSGLIFCCLLLSAFWLEQA